MCSEARPARGAPSYDSQRAAEEGYTIDPQMRIGEPTLMRGRLASALGPAEEAHLRGILQKMSSRPDWNPRARCAFARSGKYNLKENAMHCGDCRFWFQPESQCRRNAPEPLRDGASSRDTLWPKVHASDWCGEYQPGYIDRPSMPDQAKVNTA